MKKIIFIILLAIFFAQPAHASLTGYYKEQGQTLPSLKARSVIFAKISSEKYFGTVKQNIRLESFLRGSVDNANLGANTQYGMPCIYLSSNQTLTSGQGTALLCDNQGRLIITN